jgi:uncharacterized protein YdhG (YjbR/CyaY superfamily)
MKKNPENRQKEVDQYLESLPVESRKALEDLRKIIQETVPDAEQGFSYGVPAFKVNGKPLVCYASFKNHCGFYPMSPEVLKGFAPDLESYETAMGTIRFKADKPLPATLVKRIVKARLKELEE